MLGNETGEEALNGVRRTVLEAQIHQDCPFEKIVTAINPRRNSGRNPLYNVALLWQNFPRELFRGAGLKVSPIPVHPRSALLDLRFEAEQQDGEWSLLCEYDTRLFESKTIDRMLRSFSRLFKRFIDATAAPLNVLERTEPAPKRWLEGLLCH